MKNETLKTSRNYGVDALRVVSMLMIVAVHIFTQGGVLAAAETAGANRYIAWILRIFVIVSVNCFALITGYVCVDSRFRASRPIGLWLQTFAYSVGISALFRVFGISAFEPLKAVLPILSGRWWYMTAYFGIVFFLPFIGILYDHISRRQATLLVMALVCLFSLLPSVCGVDIFGLHGGYHAAWLGILAMLGGYIKRYEPLKNLRSGWLMLIYVLCMLCICAWKFFAALTPDRFVSYTSIFALVGAVALLLFFSRVQVAPAVKKAAKLLGPVTLGVYLIHVHPCVWNFVLSGRFAPLGSANPIVMVLGVLGAALGIFVVCAAVDWLRERVFRLLRLNKLAETLGDRLTALAEKLFK